MIVKNRTQKEIDEDIGNLEHEIDNSNEPNHECCAYNDCEECVG